MSVNINKTQKCNHNNLEFHNHSISKKFFELSEYIPEDENWCFALQNYLAPTSDLVGRVLE